MRSQQQHELKTLPQFFAAVESGAKTFEIRSDDRGYRVGDILFLREWDRESGYTGRTLRKQVSYLLREPGLVPTGMVCMGLCEPCPECARLSISLTRYVKDDGENVVDALDRISRERDRLEGEVEALAKELQQAKDRLLGNKLFADRVNADLGLLLHVDNGKDDPYEKVLHILHDEALQRRRKEAEGHVRKLASATDRGDAEQLAEDVARAFGIFVSKGRSPIQPVIRELVDEVTTWRKTSRELIQHVCEQMGYVVAHPDPVRGGALKNLVELLVREVWTLRHPNGPKAPAMPEPRQPLTDGNRGHAVAEFEAQMGRLLAARLLLKNGDHDDALVELNKAIDAYDRPSRRGFWTTLNEQVGDALRKTVREEPQGEA